MDPGDFEVYRRRHTIARDKGSLVSKHIAIVIHLILEVVSTEPVRAVQDKLYGDCFRGSNEVVRHCLECSVGASVGGDVIFAPVSLRASVPFGLLFLDHGHHRL